MVLQSARLKQQKALSLRFLEAEPLERPQETDASVNLRRSVMS